MNPNVDLLNPQQQAQKPQSSLTVMLRSLSGSFVVELARSNKRCNVIELVTADTRIAVTMYMCVLLLEVCLKGCPLSHHPSSKFARLSVVLGFYCFWFISNGNIFQWGLFCIIGFIWLSSHPSIRHALILRFELLLLHIFLYSDFRQIFTMISSLVVPLELKPFGLAKFMNHDPH